jgi:DNA repair exonuclease SbcCD ATPase subunit
MSKVREIRESIDKKLDHWEAWATAFEEQLQQTKEQALTKLEARKKTLNEAAEKFKAEIGRMKGIAEEKKQELQAKFDDLQVQLALGKAEAKEAFETQRKKIQPLIASLEDTVDRLLDAASHAIDEPLEKAAEKFIAAATAYEAEAEALGAQLAMKKAEAKAHFEQKKTELLAQIKGFKAQLLEKRGMAKDKAATFEKQLSDGMAQIKQAFKTLFE